MFQFGGLLGALFGGLSPPKPPRGDGTGPVIKAVNFIQARRLNHLQFQKFLDHLDTEHQDLLYFSEMRWLRKGSMLRRFYELRKEFTLFLKNNGQPVAEMEDESWLCDLAFLVDITTHMNDLNTMLQRQTQYERTHKRLYEQVKTLASSHAK